MKRILIFAGLKILELSLVVGVIWLLFQFKWFKNFIEWYINKVPSYVVILIGVISLIYIIWWSIKVIKDNWKWAKNISKK